MTYPREGGGTHWNALGQTLHFCGCLAIELHRGQLGLAPSQDPGRPAWVKEQLCPAPLPQRYRISYLSLRKQAQRSQSEHSPGLGAGGPGEHAKDKGPRPGTPTPSIRSPSFWALASSAGERGRETAHLLECTWEGSVR